MYHFVHGYGAVGYCDEADYYAEGVVPVLYEGLVGLVISCKVGIRDCPVLLLISRMHLVHPRYMALPRLLRGVEPSSCESGIAW
jgi:hypothetical protein